MTVHELYVDDFLAFIQLTQSNPRALGFGEQLVIGEKIKVSPILVTVEDRFVISQGYSTHKSVVNLTVTDDLPLYQQAAKGPALQVVTDVLPLYDRTRPVKYDVVQQHLVLGEAVGVQLAKAVFQTLVMNESIFINVRRNLGVQQTLIMTQGQTFFVSDEDSYSIPIPPFNGPNKPEC